MSAPVAADVHIALRDGSTAHVRPVVPSDEPALRSFLANPPPPPEGYALRPRELTVARGATS